jgi:hypothetical protein
MYCLCTANVSGIFYTAHKVAKQLDAEIGKEKYCYISGCENEWNRLPPPNSPLTVGIDGGYIHAREGSNRKAGWFEAIVGKSLHVKHNLRNVLVLYMGMMISRNLGLMQCCENRVFK